MSRNSRANNTKCEQWSIFFVCKVMHLADNVFLLKWEIFFLKFMRSIKIRDKKGSESFE